MLESDSGSPTAILEESPHKDNDDPDLLLESASDSPPPEPSSHIERPTNKRTRKKNKLLLLGKEVCQAAHQRLMGIGTSIIEKLRRGERAFTQKQRTSLPKHPGVGKSLRGQSNDKWPRVLCFLWLLYHSQAEVLPTKFVMPTGYLKEGAVGCDDDDEEDGDFQTRYVTSFLQGLESHQKMPDISSIGPGSFSGPRRYIQHRKPVDVYNEYVASEISQQKTPCSLSTFLKVFKPVAKDHLKFRSRGEHAECNVCSKFKRNMSKARNTEERQKIHRAYSEHILSQWVDRQTYWHQRTLSQSWFRSSGFSSEKKCFFVVKQFCSCATAGLYHAILPPMPKTQEPQFILQTCFFDANGSSFCFC